MHIMLQQYSLPHGRILGSNYLSPNTWIIPRHAYSYDYADENNLYSFPDNKPFHQITMLLIAEAKLLNIAAFPAVL